MHDVAVFVVHVEEVHLVREQAAVEGELASAFSKLEAYAARVYAEEAESH